MLVTDILMPVRYSEGPLKDLGVLTACDTV